VVAAAAEVAAGAEGAEASVVAAVAGLLAAEVAAGSLAAEGAAAAGSAASGSVAARVAPLARAAAYPGERAACAKCHVKRRCDGRRISSGLPPTDLAPAATS
jgi:hypothetical protein